MKKYQHVISLGHFCAVATELEKLGLRDASLPFDWVISPLKSVIHMIETEFQDFLVIDNLRRDERRKYIVKDTKYDIAFYHDFKPTQTIESSYNEVLEKYRRRIDRFYQYITKKTLFIRYIETKQEYEYICDNYESIISMLKKHNKENELLLISKDVKMGKLPMYTIYRDKKPYGSRQKFVRKNKELYKKLTTLPYPKDKKRANLKRYKKALPNRIVNAIKKAYKKLVYS